MPVRHIDHILIAMPAGREEEARAFYRGVLGMSEKTKPPILAARGGCWFTIGALEVHLGVDKNFIPGRKAHPAFIVDDLAGMIEKAGSIRLQRHGRRAAGRLRPPPRRRSVRQPDRTDRAAYRGARSAPHVSSHVKGRIIVRSGRIGHALHLAPVGRLEPGKERVTLRAGVNMGELKTIRLWQHSLKDIAAANDHDLIDATANGVLPRKAHCRVHAVGQDAAWDDQPKISGQHDIGAIEAMACPSIQRSYGPSPPVCWWSMRGNA